MKIFNNIKDFVNYIPHCIICGKNMNIVLVGLSYSNGKMEDFSIKINILNNLLLSKNKNYKLMINIDNNFIIEGHPFINKIGKIHLNKYCKTCNFKIKSGLIYINNKKYFPSFYLRKETICFTRKNHTKIKINNFYCYPYNYTLSHNTFINNKKINNLKIDIYKFKTLKHLNKRISTFITFQ